MFLMWGYEGETLEDMEATVEHVKEANPDIFFTTVAYPIKNTAYHAVAADRVVATRVLGGGDRPRLRRSAAATPAPTTSTPTAGCAARWRAHRARRSVLAATEAGRTALEAREAMAALAGEVRGVSVA